MVHAFNQQKTSNIRPVIPPNGPTGPILDIYFLDRTGSGPTFFLISDGIGPVHPRTWRLVDP